MDHQTGVNKIGQPPKSVAIPIEKIAFAGYPLDEYTKTAKVSRMRAKLQSGKELPPVELSKLTPADRKLFHVTDPTKTHFLHHGHHRLAATHAEGREDIQAVPFLGKGL